MDARLNTINYHLRKYDPELYASWNNDKFTIYRKSYRWDTYWIGNDRLSVLRQQPLYIISLTDNWKPDGKSVEWGIEPMLDCLKSQDMWRNPNLFNEMVEGRERRERYREQSKRNDIRARAADLRRDFARATNDINTSTLEKVDNRRKKDGYC